MRRLLSLLALALLLPAASARAESASLEGAEHLARFFAALRERENLEPTGRIRITHFGDSHIAADLWTGALRGLLQGRFGDGGRGFVLLGRPWSSYGQAQVRGESSGDWRVDGLREGLDDGRFGAWGCSIASDDPGAVARVSTPDGKGFRIVDLHYLRQPGAGCFEVLVDDKPAGRVDARGPWADPGFSRFEVEQGPHRLAVRPLGGGEVRLLGASLENEAGLIYDALGLNGAQARRILRQDPAAFALVVRRLNPTLLIVSYGTNEAFDGSQTAARYQADLETVLKRLRESAAEADCLVTGPFDFQPPRRAQLSVDSVVGIQRALADAHGCAFWDARLAMGGPGAIRAWRKRGLAQRDHVHLTREGYIRIAELMFEALLGAHYQGTGGR